MDNYIKKPRYINHIDSIHSNNFKKIDFSNYLINEESKYSIDLLRDIYIKDKDLFFNTRDEMLLRGFEINLVSESSLFTQLENKINDQYILVTHGKNKKNHLGVNFDKVGLGNFINRFKVDKDDFFHLIPLNNFKYINNGINTNLLSEEFSRNNFRIISEDRINTYIREEKEKEDEIVEESSIEIVTETPVRIENYFNEGIFNIFVDYCFKNDIYYVHEITDNLIQQFKGVKFVGEAKYEALINKYTSFGKYEASNEENTNDPIFKIDNLLFKHLEINDFFSDSKFKRFKRFCMKNDRIYLEDLTQADLSLFKDEKGVGSKRINDVKEHISIIKEELSSKYSFIFNYNLDYFDIHDYSVNEILKILNISEKIEKEIIIEEIFDQDIRNIEIDEESKKVLFKLTTLLSSINNPDTIINSFLSKLTSRDYDMLIHRFKNRETLATIGKKYDLTRERVRQITNRTCDKFVSYLKNNFFKESILLTFLSFDYLGFEAFTYSDFSHFIDRTYLFVLEIFAETDDLFYYESTYGIFFLSEKDRNLFLEETNNIVEQLPDFFVIEEVEEIFKAQYFRRGMLSVEQFLSNNSFKKYGKIYSEENLTISDILVFLFKNDLPAQVEMTEENYEKIVKLAKEKYHYEIENPIVSTINALRNSEDFLLVDSNTYQLLNIADYNIEILEECINYCESQLKKRNTINIHEVFTSFKEKLVQNNIDNKTHLYSILKHLYGDKFQFGKGNTLNIYSNTKKKIDDIDLMIDFMKANDGIRSKNEIKKYFRWSEQKISLKTSVSNIIISWGKNYFRLSDGWISNDAIEEVKNIINDFFKRQGFITEGQLYDEALFSIDLYTLIEKENIDSSEKFRSSFRPYIDALKGNSVFITPDDSKYSSIYEALVEKYSDGVSREELIRYLSEELHYRESTLNMIIDKLISDSIMIEINLGYFYPKSNINISKNIIERLLEYIEIEKNGKPYIILKNLEGYRSKLPTIDVEWTPYLIKQLLLNHGYKNVEAYNSDYRTDQLILIEEDHDINYIDELLFVVLKNNYEGNKHESYIARYLEREGFIYEKKYERSKLPISLYKKSELIEVDELGRVQLGED